MIFFYVRTSFFATATQIFCRISYNKYMPVANIIQLIKFPFCLTYQMQALKKMKAPSSVREFSVCANQHVFLAIVYDTVRLYEIDFETPKFCIKLDSNPQSAKLSQCGKFFFIHDADNNILLYDTRQGMLIQTIIGAPTATKTIRFTKNSNKLIYGSTQMLCLWNIRKSAIDVRTQHWKNISCYDANKDGSQFVIGTYEGMIYVLDFIEVGRCSQIQIKKHKSSVVSICHHEDQIISASQDGFFLISSIKKDSNDERIITYHEMKLKSVPKEMESVGNNFYMFNAEGMTWFKRTNGLVLTGFTDYKSYRPLMTAAGQVIYVSLQSGEMEWWPAHAFKSNSEIQKSKAQNQKEKNFSKGKQQKEINSSERGQTGKENRIQVYRLSNFRRQNQVN